MTRFVRIITYVLLVSLVLSLSDWPYVDEILADLPSQQAQHDQLTVDDLAPDHDAGQSKSPIPSRQAKSCCAYGDLVNLAVFLHDLRAPAKALSHDFPSGRFSEPGSTPPDRIDRPPWIHSLFS